MDTSAVINVNVQSNDTPQAQYKTVVLKPNMVDDVNTLTQAMLTAHGQNTKFVIKYDYTLGEDITVPANCVLEFDGGSLSGAYTLTGANTGIQAGLVKIFNTNVILDGDWCGSYFYPEWFGAKGDGNTDDAAAIQACLNSLYDCRRKAMFLANNSYKVGSTLYLSESVKITSGFETVSNWGEIPSLHFYGSGNALEFRIAHNGTSLKYSLCGFSIYNESQTATNGIAYPKDNEHDVNIDGLIKCVQVRNFSNGAGIYYYCKGPKGVCYSVFENVTCSRCLIGMHFRGDDTNGRPWVNQNSFRDCYLSLNRNGGVLIEGFYDAENNDFYNCSIEGNGVNYDDDFYEEYGSFGVRVSGRGNVRLHNCYLEGNYPIKEINNANVYPSDALNNANCATIVAEESIVILENNVLAAFIKLASITAGEIVIKNNSIFQDGIPDYETVTGNSVPRGLVDIYVASTGIHSITCHQFKHTNFIKRTINKIYLKNGVSTAQSYNIRTDIKTDFEQDSNLFNCGASLVNSKLICFADEDNGTSSALLYGSNAGQPIKDIFDGMATYSSIPSNRDIIINLLNDATMKNRNTPLNASNTKIQVNGNNHHLTVGVVAQRVACNLNNCDITFNNCIFDIEATGLQYGFYFSLNVNSNNKITFNSCTFNINCASNISCSSIISMENGGYDNYVFLNDCTFNLVNGSATNKFWFVNTVGDTGRYTNQIIIRDSNTTFNNSLTSDILGDSYTNLRILPKTPYANLPVRYSGKWVTYDGSAWKDDAGNVVQ